MSASDIPRLDRRFSKAFYYVNTAIMYLTTIPANWLMMKLGQKAGMLPVINKLIEGPTGGSKAFASYTPSSHDVFVATYVKSGTNWMMQLAHQVVFHGDGEFENIHDVVAWPDMGGKFVKAVTLASSVVQNASPENKRVIKTHLSANDVPYSEAAHYLTVIRDPKEVFVSSYHFASGNNGPLMPPLYVWFELFLTKKFPMMAHGTTWAEHTASWWALRNKPNVLVLLFDEMKKDLPTTARRVADVLGVALTEDEMNRVLEKSAFSYMSANDHKFHPMPKENLPWGKNMKMVRAGKAGNSKELLTPEQQQHIDQHFRAELERLGSDFPYDEYFNSGKNP